ncbi:MAG: sensor histidine kinase [Dehalococcoidia bacterium]|nr:sensor histidine kinase [Dehalococcoidia bacterium]
MDAAATTPAAEALTAGAAAVSRVGVWRRRGDPSLSSLSGPIRLAVFTSPFIVRWATWLVALLVVLVTSIPRENRAFEPYLLIGTFVQTVVVTFYVPLVRPVLLPALRRRISIAENADVLWLGLADLALSMTAVYLSGGWGSPYFHFAITALLIPSFFMTLRGVVGLGLVYTAAYVAGLALFGEGVHGSWRNSSLNGFIGAIVTPLLVALVPNYLGSVLRDLDLARQDALDALSDSELLFRIGRAFLERGHEADDVLTHVVASALDASRFDRLLLLVPGAPADDAAAQAYGMDVHAPPPALIAAAIDGAGARTIAASSLAPPLDDAFAGCEWTAAVPLQSADAVEGWLLAGRFERPVAIFHEVRLLDAVGGQLAMGLRNLRLAARVGQLAAEGERTRIAREIHDGIAQMVFMLSLSLETAVDRVGGDEEEQRKRLRDLTALAKNALWEVRQYIFDLRPLLSGDEGLVGAVQGQINEFRAVAELPVELTVTGAPLPLPLMTSAELYRIVQEGLGNIFRHARASRVQVTLAFERERVVVTISDDGVGFGDRGSEARVGYGMGNLRRRVEDLRGRLEIASAPDVGTGIEVSIPYGGDAA